MNKTYRTRTPEDPNTIIVGREVEGRIAEYIDLHQPREWWSRSACDHIVTIHTPYQREPPGAYAFNFSPFRHDCLARHLPERVAQHVFDHWTTPGALRRPPTPRDHSADFDRRHYADFIVPAPYIREGDLPRLVERLARDLTPDFQAYTIRFFGPSRAYEAKLEKARDELGLPPTAPLWQVELLMDGAPLPAWVAQSRSA